MADDPIAATPKRRAVTRRPKGAAEPPARIVPQVIEVIDPAPVVAEDGTSLAGDHVQVLRAAVGRLEATEVAVEQGAIGAARAQHVKLERSAVGAALAENVEVSRSYARSILARQVQLDRGAARVVIAADVRTNQTAVMFLVARRVAGDVRVLLDWRGALAFGAGAGLVLALFRRSRKRT